ncbi:MAG TPA: hypothetical protein VFE62_24900, partial [Gemmataceae bacterium]|nr:hypothetical protein [Gemmataceae bacterium]
MNLRARILSLTIAIAGLAILAGCGPRGYSKITGKLVDNGKPVTVSDKGVIQVSLVAVDDTSNTGYGTTVNKDGTFVVNKQADGNYPKAGKYRVNVQVYDPYPGDDKYNGKFVGQKSPLVVDVAGDGEIT